ncbi:MAG: dCMP deaminase family protein [Firmicutes bacterium]|nr:dCMP deaminase family protein [Bacillota bacterium]
MTRPDKARYYLDIAAAVARRATCLRRQFGAIIVKDDQIISTGYVGAPRGSINCLDLNDCPREKAGIPSGERYELCRSVHAEMNAIIHASRQEMLGATLYLACLDPRTGQRVTGVRPCKLCTRMIINAGLKAVVADGPGGEVVRYSVEDWVKQDRGEWTPDNITGY